jgi:hypothetical protein
MISLSGAGTGARLASGLGGALILLVSALFTLGTSLAAPIGMFAARLVARSKGRSLTRGASWLAAATASSIAIVIAFAGLASLMPPGTFRQIEGTAATAGAQHAARPPDWFGRVFPQAMRRPDPLTERVVNSQAFRLYFGLLGAAFTCAIFGAIAGSAGWLGASLLGCAFTGGRGT